MHFIVHKMSIACHIYVYYFVGALPETYQTVSTYTYTITYTICIGNCTRKEQQVNDSLDGVKEIFQQTASSASVSICI